jgi:hypothetical protein
VEADALYHSYSSLTLDSFTDPNLGLLAGNHKADTRVWDLPLLLKYRILSGAWRPFVTGGYSVSYESNDITNTLSASIAPGSGTATYPGLGYPTSFGDSRFRRGPTAGAGVEYRFGKVKIAPEVRYNRIDNPNTNQVTVMFGLTF